MNIDISKIMDDYPFVLHQCKLCAIKVPDGYVRNTIHSYSIVRRVDPGTAFFMYRKGIKINLTWKSGKRVVTKVNHPLKLKLKLKEDKS